MRDVSAAVVAMITPSYNCSAPSTHTATLSPDGATEVTDAPSRTFAVAANCSSTRFIPRVSWSYESSTILMLLPRLPR